MFLNTSRSLLLLALSLFTGFIPLKAAELFSVIVSKDSETPYFSEPILLAAGDLFEMEYVSNTNAHLHVTKDGQNMVLSTASTGSSGINFIPTVPKILGPAEIKIGGDRDATILITYKITRASTPVTAVPSTAVVIPENVTGDFQVILEASADLQTWTPVSPGTFSSTHPQRFFRTRIFKTP